MLQKLYQIIILKRVGTFGVKIFEEKERKIKPKRPWTSFLQGWTSFLQGWTGNSYVSVYLKARLQLIYPPPINFC
jgi:hypothetical protein